MSLWNQGQIKVDNRVSKCNYGSQKNYLIESVILEKRLMHNNSRLLCKEIVYNLTDLQVCYNRQLANLARIAEESIGIERELIKLFIKVLSWFKHFICIGYRISEEYYGEPKNQTGETRQGIKLSSDA